MTCPKGHKVDRVNEHAWRCSQCRMTYRTAALEQPPFEPKPARVPGFSEFALKPPAPPREHARARHTDPKTSHDAAATVNVESVRGSVIAVLSSEGPGTSEQITAWCKAIPQVKGRPLVTISSTLRPMERKGLVERVGRRRNISSTFAIVWALPNDPRSAAVGSGPNEAPLEEADRAE